MVYYAHVIELCTLSLLQPEGKVCTCAGHKISTLPIASKMHIQEIESSVCLCAFTKLKSTIGYQYEESFISHKQIQYWYNQNSRDFHWNLRSNGALKSLWCESLCHDTHNTYIFTISNVRINKMKNSFQKLSNAGIFPNAWYTQPVCNHETKVLHAWHAFKIIFGFFSLTIDDTYEAE